MKSILAFFFLIADNIGSASTPLEYEKISPSLLSLFIISFVTRSWSIAKDTVGTITIVNPSFWKAIVCVIRLLPPPVGKDTSVVNPSANFWPKDLNFEYPVRFKIIGSVVKLSLSLPDFLFWISLKKASLTNFSLTSKDSWYDAKYLRSTSSNDIPNLLFFRNSFWFILTDTSKVIRKSLKANM